MNTILLFFALPVATIILAIVLERILRCPVLTASTFFAIYLIVAFAAFDTSFLIYVIVYTLLAYIAAILAKLFYNRCNRRIIRNMENDNENTLSNEEIRNISRQVADILSNNNCSCNCNNVATVNVRNSNGEQTTWCCRRR